MANRFLLWPWLLSLIGRVSGDAMVAAAPGTMLEPNNTEVVAFSSDEGRRLFRGSMKTEYMKSYARLSDQSATQNVTTTCGVASLIMVLNALNLDPETGWRMKNMWYRDADSDTIDNCCKARVDILPDAAAPGLLLSQLLYTANCNGLDAAINYGPEVTAEKFHDLVKEVTSSPYLDMAVNFYRPDLGQIGGGHFSPIGGYSEKSEKVLILDTARYKYPAYWAPVELVWKAMNNIDSDSQRPRGYIVFWPKGKQGPSSDYFVPKLPRWTDVCSKQPFEERKEALPDAITDDGPGLETQPRSDEIVAFSSRKGQELFVEALRPDKLDKSDNMESYSILADQAVTQLDMAASGLASISMVLNAMNLDPDKGWRTHGKWFKDGTDASINSCCKQRKRVVNSEPRGLTLEEMYYTIQCNGLKAHLNFASNFTLEHLRNIVDVVTQSQHMVMIVQFDRMELGMTGARSRGHHSPVGGFNRTKDMVLIMETTRYLYPTFWVPLAMLHKGMSGIDKGSFYGSRSRGYLIVSREKKPAELRHWKDVKTGESKKWGWNFAQPRMKDKVCCHPTGHENCVDPFKLSKYAFGRQYQSKVNKSVKPN